jgi:hypothetical protein
MGYGIAPKCFKYIEMDMKKMQDGSMVVCGVKW